MQGPDNTDNEFNEKTEKSFRDLFEAARIKNELHFAMALMPEMRGAQDPGWNTAEEAQRTFDEYLEFMEKQPPSPMKCRIALGFYCHIAEASGLYEVPKNMLRIAEGLEHNLWPFSNLVDTHKQTGDKIAPNANKILKDLAGHSKSLGFDTLSEVFRDAFDPDVRNGYAHADYVIWDDGLRLRKRNGGIPKKISWEEFHFLFRRGINFFQILSHVRSEYVRSYDPPKSVMGRLGNAPVMSWTIYFDSKTGAFGLTNGTYPDKYLFKPS